MQTRRFGRTNHFSTIAIFGGVALGKVDQAQADLSFQQVLDAGINHIDIAPSYADAEIRLGPWMPAYRNRFFLGCKTTERSRESADAELRRSLKRLQTDHFDLYQLHAVKTMEELDLATMKGGALEAVIQARAEGLTRFIGITTHGFQAPLILQEALRRFDFDTVLFPINFVQYAIPEYRRNCEETLQLCQQKDVGTMIIKSICKAPWGERERQFHCWYEPFSEPEMIQKAVNFALSQPVTGLCTVGDYRLFPLVLDACERFHPLSIAEQETLIQSASAYEPLFA